MHAAILGLIQGLGEFLPISSSAHLILAPRFFHWQDPGLAFDVALHLGTLLAVVLYFWKDLLSLLQSVVRPSGPGTASDRRVVGLLLAATIPGAVAGVLLEHKAETVFRSASLIAYAMIGLGLLLGIADWLSKGERRMESLSFPAAVGIGLAQSFALIPGVSRSGSTITIARFLGLDRQEAARFSFLMSAPIIAGAGVLKFKEIIHSPDHAALAAGFATSAVSGFAAIWFLMRYVQHNRYTPFVVYRWALGAYVLLHLSQFAG
ncbi:MAG TPA: undecaprenyl-diphosphatase UppP [Elusimicrobiota bacterium]|nr:undecaprenyl-diphosphatase UppP [Elusimicrobiota bacterium]